MNYSIEGLLDKQPDIYIVQRGPMNRSAMPAQRPIFKDLAAVINGQVYPVDEKNIPVSDLAPLMPSLSLRTSCILSQLPNIRTIKSANRRNFLEKNQNCDNKKENQLAGISGLEAKWAWT